MREIKFRVWNNVAKDYVNNMELFVSFNHTNRLSSQSYTIIEQYTGLKDSNGVEIYEGDIIDNMIVTYCGNTEDSLDMCCGWYLQSDNFEKWTELLCIEKYTIIGNIHQNKTLLED